MKSFEYVIKDELGIHARPAGLLLKEAKKFNSKIVITKDDKQAEATKLMALMALGIKQKQKIVVTIEGDDEEIAIKALQNFFEEQL